MVFKIILESITMAFQQLWGNKLRTFLTLLGIIIGIWCIITVLSAVDSLEKNIRTSLNKLGDDVVYVQKMPWGGSPDDDWLKYLRRPEPNYKDFKALEKKLNTADIIGYSTFVGVSTAQYKSSTVERTYIIGASYDYAELFSIEFEQGRYFSPSEHFYGGNQVVIGYEVAKKIFGENINPIGKRIKVYGRKMQVLGVIEKAGDDLLNPVDFDEVVLMSINTAKKMVSLDKGAMIAVKAAEDVSMEQLKDDITSVLRANRQLKPKQEDNFALNQLSIIANFFDQIFGVINGAGWFIGIFSIIVGIFGVANIMFVSVKERTSIIGVKKALGAKRYVILLEFLIESIILCLIGGIIGLMLVFGMVQLANAVIDFQFFLSAKNIILGSSIAIATGILAGIIPAVTASNLDPVVAMRQ